LSGAGTVHHIKIGPSATTAWSAPLTADDLRVCN
jgi:hypothetical protein